ncbi:MAG: NAD(+)/NADH kinase [Lachnospiraceae bacterium]|nr:NAD(+)/NADH kinase [Lachnospiraceae bacterium]
MENFCIITNSDKDYKYELANSIKEKLVKMNKNCLILPNILNENDGEAHYTDTSLIEEGTECAIILGGDGTVIQAAIDLAEVNIPMLALNNGTVGYLTEYDVSEAENALKKLNDGDYTIEERIMLKTDGVKLKGIYSLNDIVIFKRGRGRLITVAVYANDRLMDKYCADGIIISTPTGSTGYNLSAGGPVMDPHTQATVVTPICPHALNKRSIVLDPSDKIRVEILKTKDNFIDNAVLISDGREVEYLVSGDSVNIVVPENTTKLIKMSDESFYERMRQKMIL